MTTFDEGPIAVEDIIDIEGAIKGEYDVESGEYEYWKPIDNTDREYWVTSLGRVWSAKQGGRFMKICKTGLGYPSVSVNRKNQPVNRLVAEYFVPNPENKNHAKPINGDYFDSRASNLEWCGQYEKAYDVRWERFNIEAYPPKEVLESINGNVITIREQDDNPREPQESPNTGCYHSEAFKREAAEYYHTHDCTMDEVAKKYGVSRGSISDWYHKIYPDAKDQRRKGEGKENKKSEKRRKIPDIVGQTIAETYHKGIYTYRQVADMFKVSKNAVKCWHKKIYGESDPRKKLAYKAAKFYHNTDYTPSQVAKIFQVKQERLKYYYKKLYGNQKPQSE